MASSPDVIVIGAGVLGLCTAAELAARGHAVTVIVPGGPNASSIAAGMIAPALESLLEAVSSDRAALLKRARDLWPAFAETHALKLMREGADWHGPDAAGAVTALHRLGFEASPAGNGLNTPDDWRIEVRNSAGEWVEQMPKSRQHGYSSAGAAKCGASLVAAWQRGVTFGK